MEYLFKFKDVLVLFIAAALFNSSLSVDITGYVGRARRQYGIFDQQLDWFQAAEQCKEDGYEGLEVFPKMNSRLSLIEHFLRENTYQPNSTFWTGLFRQYSHLTKWYESGTDHCDEYPNDVVEGKISCDHLCVSITLLDLYDQISLRAQNCSSTFPYICYKPSEPVKYDFFYNYSFSSLPSYANVDVQNTVNISLCKNLCTQRGQCVGFTYSHSGQTCSMMELDSGYGYMTYSLNPVGDHTVHGYKTRPKPIYYPTVTYTSPPDTNYTFPACNVSDIPPGYCRCNISIQRPLTIDNSVEELIQNLTVNKDETSKSRRKLISADDDRPSAKAVGVVGLIILITFALILFVLDFNLLLEQAINCVKLFKKFLQTKWKMGKVD